MITYYMQEVLTEETLNLIAQTIYDKKGENIVALDVRGTSNLTDFVLIADGNVYRHVAAIAREIVAKMKEKKIKADHLQGMEPPEDVDEGSWIVMDFNRIIVHIMTPDYREKYQLEALWQEAKSVPLHIETHSREEDF